MSELDAKVIARQCLAKGEWGFAQLLYDVFHNDEIAGKNNRPSCPKQGKIVTWLNENGH
jgi:hypothetical protein